MSLWDTLRGWVERDAKKLLYVPIPSDHTDAVPAVATIDSGKHYFRLWITEMHLKRDQEWFKSWYPVAHTLIRFQFGGKQVEVANIAGALKLPGIEVGNLDQVITLNHPLSTLMPFRGGVVEVMAGLFAMKEKDFLRSFLSVLEDLSGLLVAPQLSAALKVAEPIVAGVDKLLQATDGQLHLGLHQTYVGQDGGGNRLRPGYFAVLRAEENQVDISKLWIKGDQLRFGNDMASSTPYKAVAHMVFRIEGQTTRDDWDALTAIAEPRADMLEALALGRQDEAQTSLNAAIVAVYRSADLTEVHKRVVTALLKKEFDSFGMEGPGFESIAPTRPQLLSEAMKKAPAVRNVSGEPVTLKELLEIAPDSPSIVEV